MDATLRRLLAAVLDGVDTAVQGVRDGAITADQFQAEMARRLFEGHVAAYLAGRGVSELTPRAERLVKDAVIEQLDYLNKFADTIAAEGWREAFGARAMMYAGSVKPTYFKAKAFGLDMPYYPGDGSTPCKVNCRCSLDIQWLDEEELNADVYWRLGAEEHCQTCPQRAADSPYRFRGGERV